MKLIKNLTDEAFVSYIHSRISDSKTHDYGFYGGTLNRQDGGTAHISIVAANGDAVSMTSTINDWFSWLFNSNIWPEHKKNLNDLKVWCLFWW
jgi:gamma-glutamyltranspeptidase